MHTYRHTYPPTSILTNLPTYILTFIYMYVSIHTYIYTYLDTYHIPPTYPHIPPPQGGKGGCEGWYIYTYICRFWDLQWGSLFIAQIKVILKHICKLVETCGNPAWDLSSHVEEAFGVHVFVGATLEFASCFLFHIHCFHIMICWLLLPCPLLRFLRHHDTFIVARGGIGGVGPKSFKKGTFVASEECL
jgi:hypothetical protein